MYTITRSPRGTIVPNGTQRTGVKLANGGRTEFLTVVARCRVTISVAAATSIINRGSVFSLFDEIVLDENGEDRYLTTGKVLRFASEMAAPSALSATRLTSTAVGVYNLEEAARMYFAHPLSLDPVETAFIERDVRQTLLASVRANVAALTGGTLVIAGGATVVVDNVTVDVIQTFERASTAKPLFIPTVRQIIAPVNGTVNGLIIPLLSTKPIRQIIISQEAGGVEVGDVLGAFSIKGDYTNVIGPTVETYRDALLDNEFEQGGAVVGAQGAHIGYNFQRYGRLSNSLNPAQDANLRIEANVTPSASAGQSQLRITLFELSRDPGIVAEKIPFPI